MSGPQWRFGFGWGAIGLLGLLVIVSLAPIGIVRWVFASSAVLVLAFMVIQYRRWNEKGWRQVHLRAMLLYASIAGAESGKAEREGREFNRVTACRELARVLSAGHPLATNQIVLRVDAPGKHFAELFEEHAREILRDIDDARLSKLSEYLRDLQLGPQLIVANIVEDRFGELEAARYGLAILRQIAGEPGGAT
jgi:hypothetical protein